MSLTSHLVAKLGLHRGRNERVARRIESLGGTAGPVAAPRVSVFRRGDAMGRPSIGGKTAGGLRSRIAVAVQAPTSRIWAPANGNAVVAGRLGIAAS